MYFLVTGFNRAELGAKNETKFLMGDGGNVIDVIQTTDGLIYGRMMLILVPLVGLWDSLNFRRHNQLYFQHM
jgi:hypothetical protein